MKKRVLIVENDQRIIDQVRESLKEEDFSFDVVEDGQQAMNSVDAGNYDLVISGVMISRVHGFELSSYVAANFPDTRIILTSNVYKGMEYQHRAIHQYHADGYLEKPFENQQLKRMVEEVFAGDGGEASAQNGIEENQNTGTGTKTKPGSPVHEVDKTLNDMILPEESFKSKTDFRDLENEIESKYQNTLQELGISEDKLNKNENQDHQTSAPQETGSEPAGKKRGKSKKLRGKKK